MADATLAARAKLDVNFNSKSLTGQLTDFRDRDNNAIVGDVNLQGHWQTGGNHFNRVNLSGQLDLDGSDAPVTGEMSGNFRDSSGKRADLIEGYFHDLKIGDQDYVGGLVAER